MHKIRRNFFGVLLFWGRAVGDDVMVRSEKDISDPMLLLLVLMNEMFERGSGLVGGGGWWLVCEGSGWADREGCCSVSSSLGRV